MKVLREVILWVGLNCIFFKFFVGVYPGLNNNQIDYMLDIFSSFMQAL